MGIFNFFSKEEKKSKNVAKDRFGKDGLLPFTISDMDFQAPKEIIEVLIKRVNHGVFGYSRWA